MEQLTSVALITLLAASVLELTGVAPRWRPGYWLSSVACVVALVAFVRVLALGETVSFRLWTVSPALRFQWRMDGLGALLGALVSLVAVFSSVFAVRYSHRRRSDDAVYPLFLVSMIAVAGAGNVFTFFVAWELMALASFLLVLGDGRSHGQRVAALLYLGMTHVATVGAMTSLLLLSHDAGSQEFSAMSAPSPARGAAASLAMMLALVGFGTKAGLMPLHVWLPRAHPVAPSHVSALMSAAMVSTGIYGIARVGFDFLGPGENWWGPVLMAVGACTAALGILYALMERDIKRCLAYSTVENMGIVTLALGVALSFRAAGANDLAAAALLAAFVHTVNHALLKSLLFLGAGSIQHGAHSLDLDRLGGLFRVMPLTGIAVLVGACGLASIPPLNGFVGEWMLARSLVSLTASDVGATTALVAVGALALLALAAGLALACFVRLFGIAFLGVFRSPDPQPAPESPRLMTLPLLGLALLSCTAGVAAPALVRLLRGVTEGLVAAPGAHVEGAHRVALSGAGSFSPLVLAGALLLLAPLPWLALRLAFGRTDRGRAPVWTTGGSYTPSMQYSGTSLSKPIRLFFRRVLLPERQVSVEYHGSSPLLRRVHYSGRVPAIIEERVYLPMHSVAIWSARRVRALQNGSVEFYLLYVFLALVALLVVAR